jgi:hypothetical protein
LDSEVLIIYDDDNDYDKADERFKSMDENILGTWRPRRCCCIQVGTDELRETQRDGVR